MKVFDKYASYYNLLYKDKDYKKEVDYIHQLVQENHPAAKSILDLGCGTGKHDFYLAELGYSVDGVDFSDSMIAIANENLDTKYKAYRENLSFSDGDVRNFRNDRKYDVVVSLFHVMSYQTTNEDLKAAFETAQVHLKEGGIFIFDFWYGPGVLSDQPVVRVKRLEDEHIHVTRIAEPVMYPNENCVDVNYTVFINDKKTGGLEEVKEVHRMRYLFLPEIENFSSMKCEKTVEWQNFEIIHSTTWNACSIFKNYGK